MGLRILFKSITLNSQLLRGLGILWFIALGIGVFIASEVSSSYKHHATATQEITLIENPKHSFRLRMDEDLFADSLNKKGFLFNDPALRERRHRFGLHLGGDYDEFGIHHAYFHIEKSTNQAAFIREKFTALGPNYEIAAKNATQIVFPFQQKDTLLLVGRNISYPNDKAYRGQDADITLYLPLGYTVWIDENTKEMVSGNWDGNLDDYSYNGKSKEAFMMTEDGLKPKFGVLKPKLDENQDNIEQPEKPEEPEAPEKKEAPEKSDTLTLITHHKYRIS